MPLNKETKPKPLRDKMWPKLENIIYKELYIKTIALGQ